MFNKISFFILSFLLCFTLHAQYVDKFSIKFGFDVANQIQTSPSGLKKEDRWGFNFSVEPTLFSFGKSNQFDFNIELADIQKGAYDTEPVYGYNSGGQIIGIGSIIFPTRFNYFSVTPNVRYNLKDGFYYKIGPSIGYLLEFSSNPSVNNVVYPDKRTINDFYSYTLGLNYGLGFMSKGKKIKFITELCGINDFTNAGERNSASPKFRNNVYYINFGILIMLK